MSHERAARRGGSVLSWSLVLAFAVLLLSSPTAQAQGVGSVSGTVRNAETGELLDYANVVVSRIPDDVQWGTMSLGGGRFFLRDLPAGQYKISVLYLGYKRISDTITVNPGEATEVTFDLEVTIVKTFDEFVVEGEAVMVEVKDTEFSQTVRSEDLTNYAIDTVEDAVARQAGVVSRAGELHVRGGRSGEISFRIDGVEVDDPLGGGAMSVGSLGVAAVETVTGGQDPEYGNALSGVVDISTREGTDEFEARARYTTDDFGRQDRTYTNYDRLEFALGGPTPVPRFTYFVNADMSFTDQENFNRAERPEHKVELFGSTLFKWRRRQANSVRGATKLAYALDENSRKKITGEYTVNYSRRENFTPNWDVQGFARQVLMMPEIERVSQGYRYTGRVRQVYYGPWVDQMQDRAYTVQVADELDNSNFRQSVPVLELRDTRGQTFLAAAQPLYQGFRNPASTFSTVAEDSSYVDFNSANRGPQIVNMSTQAKLVWRHALNETDFYTMRLARLEFSNDQTVGSDKQPYEYLHGGIRSPDLFRGDQNIWQTGTGFYTDADQPFFVTSGEFPVFNDQTSTQYSMNLDFTSNRYEGHKIKTGVRLIYNDLEQNVLAFPARERRDRFTGQFAQGGNQNVFHTFNPEGSFYVQDRWEYEGMVINGGFRWDMFSPGSGAAILLDNEDVDRNVTKYKHQFSPRLGFAFPITDRDGFHFSYGRFVQFPDRSVLFASQDPIGNVGILGNPNLDAELTISYQAGIKHQFTDHLAGQFAVYNKDIYGLIASTTVTDETTGNTLARYINQAFANARGLEVTLEKRPSNRWAFELAYSYAFADGVASDPAFGSNPDGLEFLPNQELSLDWDLRHSLNLSLFIEEPDSWGASMLFSYGSGYPWTPSFRFEKRVDPLLENSERLPSEYSLDVQAQRHVNVYGQRITLYFQGFNLINQDIVNSESPGIFPGLSNGATAAYREYLTETGKFGGAYLQDVDGDNRDDFVPVNDPRVFGQHRLFRVGIGWQF